MVLNPRRSEWQCLLGIEQKPNKCSHLTQIATRLFVFSLRSIIHKKHSAIRAGATGIMCKGTGRKWI